MINKGPRDSHKYGNKEVLLYFKVFSKHFTVTGARNIINFVVPRTLLYRGLFNQGSTALTFCPTIIILLSKIQLVVYYQCFFLIG